jgi:hypothetical protein
MKYLIFLIILLSSCKQVVNRQKLYNSRWVYSEGYYVGDLIHFMPKDSVIMKNDRNTVFVFGKSSYIIESIDSKYLYIESLDGKHKGKYEVF